MPEVLIEGINLHKYFPVKEGLLGLKKLWLKAVDGVNIRIHKGEMLGLVGESGSGKSTLGRMLAGILKPTRGIIRYRGKDVYGHEYRLIRKKIQLIFQNPDSSLNPRMRIKDVLEEAIRAGSVKEKDIVESRIMELLRDVGLGQDVAMKYPHQLSGGMKQRVAIARALAVNPDFIIADEIVSALDVSVKAQILNLMVDLQEKFGLTCLFISHDIPVVGYVSDRIAVMYLGKIMEVLPADKLFEEPLHPYTRALLSSMPSLYFNCDDKVILKGEIPSPVNPPMGCRLSTRCPFAKGICRRVEPELKRIGNEHFVACHLY